jgi:hypothetical protein
MKLEFSNVHCDGDVREEWQVLLRIVGDFALRVGNSLIYREVEFCLVEFAVALANWLVIATDTGPDFVYTSMESETEGLIRFTRLEPGTWRVSAAHEDQAADNLLAMSELKKAGLAYVRDLRAQLRPKWDILRNLKDPKIRERLERQLEQ